MMCAALLMLLSCDRKEDAKADAAPLVLFSAEEVDTKSFISDVNRSGNQIVVFDYMKTPGTNAYEWYIDHRRIFCEVDGQQVWDFVQGDEYYWLDDSIHNSFGWLYMGPGGNTTETFFEVHPDIDKENFKLNIPQKTFNLDTPIYDFLYSDVERREFNREDPDTSPLKLKMSHLFSAFRFRVKNLRTDGIEITGASLIDVTNTKSATIDFSKVADPSKDVTVSYGNTSSAVIKEARDDISLNSGSDYVNLLHPTDPEGYHMIWPQTANELNVALLNLHYSQNDKNDKKTIALTSAGTTEWLPGNRYSYDLVFTDQEVIITCNVTPWSKEKIELEFSDVVVVSDKMQWHRSTVESVDEHTGEVVLKNDATADKSGTCAECWFKIASPVGRRWEASLIGDAELFEFVDPVTGNVIPSPSGATGDVGVLKIRAKYNAGITDTKKAVLRIVIPSVDASGQTIVVENLGSGHDFHEYTLVRNATH